MARKIEQIVIHCSDSPNGRTLFSGSPGDKNFSTPVQEIDRWHRARGFARLDQWRRKENPTLTSIGYHFVVYTRGAVATGRHVDEVGAHAHGYNATSLGICLIGKDKFTRAQWDALKALVSGLRAQYPGAEVVGHRDLQGVTKTCPNFDVMDWIEGGMAPLEDHLLVDPVQGVTA